MSDVLPSKSRTRESTVSDDNKNTQTKKNRKQVIIGQNPFSKRHANKPTAPIVQLSPTEKNTNTDDHAIYELENCVGKQITLSSYKDEHLKTSFQDGQTVRCSSDPQLSKTCSKEEEQSTDSGAKCSDSLTSSRSDSDDISISSSATYESKENSPFESQTKNLNNSIEINSNSHSGSSLDEEGSPVGKLNSAQESIKHNQTSSRWSHMLLTHNTHSVVPHKERTISNCVE